LALEFNIANGFTFVERYEDYYYMFGFGAPVANKRTIDTYFNSLNSMHDFLQAFKHQQRKLITDMDKHRIKVPKSRQDCNLNKMLMNSNQRTGHLTPQELACIKGLAKGLSYKDIAKSLNLSPRTVETYLNRVRLRFDLHHKRELVELL
jgi:DNA-binding CsgD family transcriptional regulator